MCPQLDPNLRSSAAEQMATESTAIEELPPEVLTRALQLLDGPSLAAASSASSLLRSLSSQSDLWLELCLSAWPSLRHPLILPSLSASPRSFFSDAFPFPDAFASSEARLPDQLFSAVDIFHRGAHIFSRVIETDASSPWFRGSPFLIDATDGKAEPAAISPDELAMTWILFDPATGRAVNVSSRRAVAIERNCYTGETIVRFASAVAGERLIGAAVTCGEGRGGLRAVVLTAEDVDGTCVSGEEALKAVMAMMGAGRKLKGRWGEEQANERYFEYLRTKRSRKESRARREWALDMCCTVVGAAVFLAFLSLLLFR